jgi:hypothetical protein
MMEETIQEELFPTKNPKQEIFQPRSVENWSTYFINKQEQFKNSFIFNTKHEDKKIILIQTDQKIYIFIYFKNNLQIIANAPSKDFPDVKYYIPFAYEILDKNKPGRTSNYIFYIASKIEYFLSQEEYVVSKMTVNMNKKKITNDPLFEHNTPIIHLGMIQNNDKEYLVAGSLYPSIKIYDLYDLKEEKVIQTFHNRYLLGMTNNILIYARKEEKERRKTALTRWLYSDVNKQYKGIICTLTNSFDTKDEKLKNIFVEIHKDSYPLVTNNSSSCILLDKKENNILIYSSNTKNIQSVYAESLALRMEKGKQETIKTIASFKKYLQEIFSDENFINYIRSHITYENYQKYINNPDIIRKNSYFVEEFLTYTIKNILTTIIENEMAVENVARYIVNAYNTFLVKKNITQKTHFYDFTKDAKETYTVLQKHFSKDVLSNLSEQTFKELIKQKIKTCKPLFVLENAQNIYADNKFIFLQTDQAIWKLDLTTQKFDLVCKIDKEKSIQNLFIADNALWLITKDGMLKIDLPKEIELTLVY